MRQRRGFTLVELLVAMALVLFIMSILSQAFLAGMETFRQLKAVGDMNDRLRSATSILRDDLQNVLLTNNLPLSQAPTPPPVAGAGGQGFFRICQGRAPISCTTAVSAAGDQSVTYNTSAYGSVVLTFPTLLLVDAGTPNQEIVSIDANPAPTATTFSAPFTKPHTSTPFTPFPIVILDGTDLDNIPSVTSTNHTLHFTVNQTTKGKRRENYYFTQIKDPNGYPEPLWNYGPPAFRDTSQTYSSQWAEVAYFLYPTGNSTPADSSRPSQPLFGLYRRLVLAVPDNPPYAPLNGLLPPAMDRVKDPASSPLYDNAYWEMSCKPDPVLPGYLHFNNQSDLTIPERRFGMSQTVGSAGVPLLGPIPSVPASSFFYDSTVGVYPRIGDPIFPGGIGSPNVKGSDLLVNDVISFDIQVFAPLLNAADFTYLPSVIGPPIGNTRYGPIGTSVAGMRIFDTWSSEPPSTTTNPYDYFNSSTTTNSAKTYPFATTITAIQITLRVWDFKTNRSRQVTIVQDM